MSKHETDNNEPLEADVMPEAIEVSGEVDSAHAALEALEKQLASAEAMVAEQQNQVLRAQAEMQNIRRRAEKDVESAHKYAVEKFVNELLPVIDSLERALDVAGDSEAMSAMREGIDLTLKMFLSAIGKFQVERLDPMGQPFNPEFHQAMSAIPNPDVAPNTVMMVMQKGYTLHGRLVRPAMVMVSKTP